ncbi:glycosyltransferase family 4 protein [Roseibium denhamense]|uniref:glycosyltransferase family 4 protein n=1 Tax=Roseibium denhamense TaxID=76305 RepID=UPI001FCAFA9E|nr:glycosyltransferase family 4 protein [Roseibium denhamense]
MTKCHLVHVVRQYAPGVGGLEDFVRNLTEAQKGRFKSVSVVTLDRVFSDWENQLPASEVIDGTSVYRLPFHGSRRYPIAPRILKAIGSADLVHVHAIDFFYDFLSLSRLWHRKPLVATTHGGFFHTDKYRLLKKVWFKSLTRLSAAGYRRIACCSQSDLALFQEIAPLKATLIENGVDLQKFAEASSQDPRKHIVTIGRFSNNKRLGRLLDAVKVLVERDPDWKLDVIGVASDWSVQTVLDEVSSRGLTDHVSVLAGLENAEIKTRLSRSSLFASASDYEGFGLVLIEALSAGLLPVVHPNEAYKSLAAEHQMVRLADYASAQDAADAFEETLAKLQQEPSLRENAMASAQIHGWDRCRDLYDQMYRDALSVT